MKSIVLRQKFIDFFKSRKHTFIPSSPMVLKDDPTLLFVNAGMNQFKDIFLGNVRPVSKRVVNSQKCLRVSGKHNDLEEVGHDTYHHTMFEMLGNWSFGDYFKQEAINLAWDFLTKELKISEDRLYVTFFQGDDKDNLLIDNDTRDIWSKLISIDKIIPSSKEDNFWEMGKTGPCGPSTEIHIDLRSDLERKRVSTSSLINRDHPEVIEIWNIVFISYNRKENNVLESLPNTHVDTGMGFERLCMVLQDKKSTYDTDIFSHLITKVANISKLNYGDNVHTDIAMRVIVDHVRAIVFTISDGQIPSNTGAGYVIRRILRRAVRYAYTYLKLEEPFIYILVDLISTQFKDVYPEISEQKSAISNIIREEERAFLKTLGKGLALINQFIIELKPNVTKISGKVVFELYDTYGFPPDLTSLILKEKNLAFDMPEFNDYMQQQKSRSRSASEIVVGDWVHVNKVSTTDFIGYDTLVIQDAELVKYRYVTSRGHKQIHLVFNTTPFYAEGGGQVGDAGEVIFMSIDNKKDTLCCQIHNTIREGNLIIHIANSWPDNHFSNIKYTLQVNYKKRVLTERNHSATHLLHHVLRKKFGIHVEQRGSYVGSDYLRFDFSHFQKIQNSKLVEIENTINDYIFLGSDLEEVRSLPIDLAREMGALALFGEKYDDSVRVIQFSLDSNKSIELCGGTHVNNINEIGLFKIVSESSVAAGIRRIEAVTSQSAYHFFNKKINTLNEIGDLFKNTDNVLKSIQKIIYENKELQILASNANKNKLQNLIQSLDSRIIDLNSLKILTSELDCDIADMKNICFSFFKKYDNICVALVTKSNGKVILNVGFSKQLISNPRFNASTIVNQISIDINGKGGGQPFFAVASGDKIGGITQVLKHFKQIITNL